MDLQTLEDLIALAESQSLSQAAARRNVTQPAFSRRVRAIEEALGIQVVSRGIRPARPSDALLRNIDEIRALAHSLRRLRNDLLSTANPERLLGIAALHAIAVADLPPVLKRLTAALPFSRIRLRAANRDECFAWLMTGQVSMMLIYETRQSVLAVNPDLVEKVAVREERLVPVAAPAMLQDTAWAKRGESPLPLVGYPEDSVLGTILRDEILAESTGRFTLAAMTAFSPAVMELCENGLGVAWLPERLSLERVAAGRLVRLDEPGQFPVLTIYVTMLRVRTRASGFVNTAWDTMRLLFKSQSQPPLTV